MSKDSTTATDKNIFQRLKEAREFVRKESPTKDGENEFSNFKYFTPEFVEDLTTRAADSVGCICICDLKADEFGYFQTLRFLNIQNPEEFIDFELRTKHGEITATNAAQQMGGTDTYSERYVKMKAFGIKDNSIDPDAHDGSKGGKAKKANPAQEKVETWFNPKNAQHMQSVNTYRKQGLTGEEIVGKIRETPGFGISKVNAASIINNEI